MTTITSTTALTPDEFFSALAKGTLEVAPSFVALVDNDADDPGAISLSLDRTCNGWFTVPRTLIASLTPLGTQACDDHQHVLAKVQLNAGTDASTSGLLRLLTMQQSLFERLHALSAQETPRASSACQACIDGCHGISDWGAYIDCGTNCMNGACAPTHLPAQPLRQSPKKPARHV